MEQGDLNLAEFLVIEIKRIRIPDGKFGRCVWSRRWNFVISSQWGRWGGAFS